MDTPSPPTAPAPRFSLRNVLLIAVPLAILAYAFHMYLTHRAEMEVPHPEFKNFLHLNLIAPTKLDDGLVDADGDLVADAPKDAKEQIDPDTLVFSVLGEDVEKEKVIYADLTAQLQKATGKKVDLIVWPGSISQQMDELREGKLHLAALNTGGVSTAVNSGGIVPFCAMADDNGKFGYEMQIIVPANSAIKKPADLKGASMSFVSPYSHSGFKAPIVILWKEFNLQPGRDYRPSIEGGQKTVAKGVAKGDLKAGAVASDLLKRWSASGEIDGSKIQAIYSSSASFPNACYGYAHQLKPELAEKIKSAFLAFHLKGSSLDVQYAPAGYTKFVPISYKTDWATVREIEEQGAKLVDAERVQAKGK